MRDQLHIEELFKHQLEGLEETPSAQVWKKTARSVRRQQFMKFHPGRMNIFYVAGLVVAGGLLAVLLTRDQVPSSEKQELLSDSIHSEPIQLPVPAHEPAVIQQSAQQQNAESGKQQHATDTLYLEDITVPETGPGIPFKEQPEAATNSLPVRTLVAYFTPSVTDGCVPLTVDFSNASINAESYEWSTGGEVVSESAQTLEAVFPEAGTYNVSLVVRDAMGLVRSHTEQILVHPKPKAQFEISDGSIYNYSIGAVEYLWEIRSPGKEVISNAFQVDLSDVLNRGDSLALTATNIFGCKATMVQPLPVPETPVLLFPTAFTPNPDGATGGYYHPNEPNNQVFYPTYNEVPATYNLKIYNKTGELIFETNELERGWDGYHQEVLVPRGVYIYQCTGTWSDGEAFNYKGDVTILRTN